MAAFEPVDSHCRHGIHNSRPCVLCNEADGYQRRITELEARCEALEAENRALREALIFFRVEAEKAKEHFGDMNGDWSALAFVEMVREQIDAMPWEPCVLDKALQQQGGDTVLDTCTWALDADGCEYSTECGKHMSLPEDAEPEDWAGWMDYCCFCGGKANLQQGGEG